MSRMESTMSLINEHGGCVWENIRGYLMVQRRTDSALVHLCWRDELHPCWIRHLVICRRAAKKYGPSWTDCCDHESMGGGKGFLKIMGSSLFFSYFLNSHVQVSFCSLFLFLSCTRAAERLGVQLWMSLLCCAAQIRKCSLVIEGILDNCFLCFIDLMKMWL